MRYVGLALTILLALLVPRYAPAPDFDDQPRNPYTVFMEEGAALPSQPRANWIGTAVTCVNNAALARTDCTIIGTALGEDSVTTFEFDDAADVPVAGECVKVAGVTTQVEYSSCGVPGADSITTVELDDAADVPLAGEWLQVASVTTQIQYRTDAEARTDLGLVIGTDVQAWDAELDTIAALTETNGAVMSVAGGAWTADLTPVIDCTDCTNVTDATKLPLAGGTMTGALVADEQGVEFLESDDVVTCAAGDYWIRADLSETTLKKCLNGVETVLDTGGAEVNDLTAAVTWDNIPAVNVPNLTGTVTWGGTAILESGVAFQFGDATDANITHTVALSGTNVVLAYTSGTLTITGAVVADSFTAVPNAAPSFTMEDTTNADSDADWRAQITDNASNDTRYESQVEIAGTLTTYLDLDGLTNTVTLGAADITTLTLDGGSNLVLASGAITASDGATTEIDLIVEGAFASQNGSGAQAAITLEAATTFAVATNSVTLVCTGPETLNTITGGVLGQSLIILNIDTVSDCTIADDDEPTAANAINLNGTATNMVMAAQDVLELYFDGSDWQEVGRSPDAGGGTHDILSATHGDTLAAAVSDGSIIIGNVTPAWSELVAGTADFYLTMGAARPEWAGLTLADADNQGTTTTVLHGNAAGAVSFGSVVAGDLSGAFVDAVGDFAAGVVNDPAMATDDFGDWACAGGAEDCTLDPDVVDTSELLLSMTPNWTGVHSWASAGSQSFSDPIQLESGNDLVLEDTDGTNTVAFGTQNRTTNIVLDWNVATIAECDALGNGGKLTIDASGFIVCNADVSAGSPTLDSIAAAVGDNTIDSSEFEQTWQWNTAATATALDMLSLELDHDATTDAVVQQGLVIRVLANAGDAAGTVEALLRLENLDATAGDVVDDAIIINAAAGGITDVLDVSSANITNIMRTPTTALTAAEFDRLDGLLGNIVTEGSVAVTSVDGAGMTITGGVLNVVGGTCVTANANDVAVTGSCITTLGTVTAGVWNGTSIADANVDDNITIDHSAAGTLTLDATVAPTVDGRIAYDSTGEELEVGDDGAATHIFKRTATFTDEFFCSAESTGNAIECDTDSSGTGNLARVDSPTFTTAITVPANSISDEELDEGAAFDWTGAHTWATAGTQVFDDPLVVDNANEFRLHDTAGVEYVGFVAPGTVTANGICTLLDSTTDIVPDTCVGGILADELIAAAELTGAFVDSNADVATDVINLDEIDDGGDTPLVDQYVRVATGATDIRYDTSAVVATDMQDETQTLTNKTLDVEDTGNVVTVLDEWWYDFVGCPSATAALNWDTEASLTAPAIQCVDNGATTQGQADFDDATAEGFQRLFKLPSTWDSGSGIDIDLYWRGVNTTLDVCWVVQTACTAVGEVWDTTFTATAAADTVSDTAAGTTLQINLAAFTGITTTGCAAGELMHLLVWRDGAESDANCAAGSDDFVGDALGVGLEVTMRRAQ